MRPFLLSACLLLVAFGACVAVVSAEDEPAAPRHAPTLADLAWMTGAWVEKEGPSVFTETWSAPSGDAMVAASHWAVEGKTRMYELCVIEQTGQGPVLHVRHFHRGVQPWEQEKAGPISWPLKSLEGQHVIFEHPTRAWPKTMEYRRTGDVLEGRLVGVENGMPKQIPFSFHLAK